MPSPPALPAPPSPCVGEPPAGTAPQSLGWVRSPPCPPSGGAGRGVRRGARWHSLPAAGRPTGEGDRAGGALGGVAAERGHRAARGLQWVLGVSRCGQGGETVWVGGWVSVGGSEPCRVPSGCCWLPAPPFPGLGRGPDPAPEGTCLGLRFLGDAGSPPAGGQELRWLGQDRSPPAAPAARRAVSSPAAASEAGSDLEAIAAPGGAEEPRVRVFTAAGGGRRGGAAACRSPAPGEAPCPCPREDTAAETPVPGERWAKGSAGTAAAEGLHGAGMRERGGYVQSPLPWPPRGFAWLSAPARLCGAQDWAWDCSWRLCQQQDRGVLPAGRSPG